MDDKEFKSCPFILIRHGLSEYNLQHLVAVQEHGKESEEAKAVM